MINKELNKELTVIIPLKDRAPYTFRLMKYLDKINFPFKVLLADGGKDNGLMELLSKKSTFPNVNYEHIRYPYDRTYADYYRKMVDVLARVNTPFVALGDNDDFFCLEGLRKSIEFMKVHPEYSACRGKVIRFSLKTESASKESEGLYGKMYKIEHLYDAASITSKTASKRINEHFNHYVPTWYDVHRIDQLKRCFIILSDLNLQDIFLAELLVSIMTVLSGKVFRGPELYLLRQSGVQGSTASRENEKRGPIDRMLLNSWSADFKIFTEALASILMSNERFGQDEAIKIIKEGYSSYIKPHLIKSLTKHVYNKSEHSIVLKIMADTFKRIAGMIKRLGNKPEHGGGLRVVREYLRKYPGQAFEYEK